MRNKLLDRLCSITSYPFVIALITTIGGIIIAAHIAIFIIMSVELGAHSSLRFLHLFSLLIAVVFLPGYFIHFGLLSKIGIPALSANLRILALNICTGRIRHNMKKEEYLPTLRALEKIGRDNMTASLIYPSLVNVVVSTQVYIKDGWQNALILFLSILSATIVYAFFAYIIAETVTGEVRGRVKQHLVAQSISFREKSYLSIRIKFIFMSIFILISIIQLWYMLVFKVQEQAMLLPLGFIALTMLILVTLLFLYYQSLRDALREVEHAAVDLGRGGAGKLFCRSLDKEIISLSRGIISAAYEVNDIRSNLEIKVLERTQELEWAQKKISEAYVSMKMELNMAQTIQNAIIPKIFPSGIDYDFAGIYLPMQELGGDFYDVSLYDEDHLSIVIADVSGHGVSAALITMIAKLSFANNAIRSNQPHHVVKRVNKELFTILEGLTHYLTAFYGIINLKTNKLSYTNAGHTDILILSTDGRIKRLHSQSSFIGSFKNITYKKDTLTLEQGDRIILCTDGIPEARNHQSEFYGLERFEQVLLDKRSLSLKHYISAIKKDIMRFIGKEDQKDDITLLIAQHLPR